MPRPPIATHHSIKLLENRLCAFAYVIAQLPKLRNCLVHIDDSTWKPASALQYLHRFQVSILVLRLHVHSLLARCRLSDPAVMKVSSPYGKETFRDEDEPTEAAHAGW